ncbi:hypothetical protein Ocin01_10536 [Orchesella cincta]|uniref:Uncharacterized protein n=1 Tax=Orchesella cincta TaxID=48709 RepID=A0A1D2MT09_ORCCI|nr:hypothetical protein Ocin01_10536 [Orchesella cincta]
MEKFKTLLMNDQEPEWASKYEKRSSNVLQMNLERVSPQKLMFSRMKSDCPDCAFKNKTRI